MRDETPSALEPHYTPEQVAEWWHVDPKTVRRLFRAEDGVLRFSAKGNQRRGYTSLRIPESVLRRVHERMSRA